MKPDPMACSGKFLLVRILNLKGLHDITQLVAKILEQQHDSFPISSNLQPLTLQLKRDRTGTRDGRLVIVIDTKILNAYCL